MAIVMHFANCCLCQAVFIQDRPDIILSLIYVQTICDRKKINFTNIPSGMPSVSNSFDPVQALHYVMPDLGPK